MSRHERTALGLSLGVFLLSLTGWLFWDFFREVIVIPVYYLFWISGYIIDSIPQAAYLVLVVILCTILALAVRSQLSSKKNHTRPVFTGHGLETRYQFWSRRVSRIDQSRFMGDDFAQELRRLLLNLLAYQEGTNWSEIESMAGSGQLDIPEPAKYLISERKLVAASPDMGSMISIVQKMQLIFRQKKMDQTTLARARAETIISFIEERLEIDHELPTLPAAK